MLKRTFIFLLLSVSVLTTFSQTIPERPSPPRLVNDLAGILTAQQENELERELVEVDNRTSVQIAVVIVKSLKGQDKSMFAYEIGEKWGVGKKGFDNGVVILVKPKEIDGKGEVFIATGYGLEGVIPDAVAKRIVELEMIPHFKKKDYYGGVVAAASTVYDLASGKFKPGDYMKKKRSKGINFLGILPFLLMLIFVFFIKARRARQYSMGHDVPFWTAMTLMMMSGGAHRGRYSDFSSGSGSFGGGSGGGFGGFGGGSFGGGGAGGSW